MTAQQLQREFARLYACYAMLEETNQQQQGTMANEGRPALLPMHIVAVEKGLVAWI